MIFDLTKDFANVLEVMPREHPRQRILNLLDEAIRSNLHFLDRHPTVLFQCLFNSGGHPPGDKSRESSPLDSSRAPQDVLDSITEAWLEQKRTHQPGFIWLRRRTPQVDVASTSETVVLRGHSKEITGLAVSPAASTIVTAGEDWAMWAWDAASGKPLWRVQAHVDTIALSEDGARVITAERDSGSRLYGLNGVKVVSRNLGSGDIIEQMMVGIPFEDGVDEADDVDDTIGITDFLQSVHLSSGGRWLVGRSWGGVVLVVDRHQQAAAWCVQTSDSPAELVLGRNRLALQTLGGEIEVWDVASHVLLTTLSPTDAAVLFEFRDDDSRIVVRTADNCIQVIDVMSHEVTDKQRAFNSEVTKIASFDPPARIAVIVKSRPHEVQLISQLGNIANCGGSDAAATDRERMRIADVSANGEHLAEIAGSTLRITRSAGDVVAEIDFGSARVAAARFDSRGESIAVATNDGFVTVYDCPSRELRHKYPVAGIGSSLAWSTDSGRLAIGARDGSVTVRDLKRGACTRLPASSESTIRAVSFQPQGLLLAAGADDGEVRIWETSTERVVATLRCCAEVLEVAWSPDGTRLTAVDAGVPYGIDVYAQSQWDAFDGRMLNGGPDATTWAVPGFRIERCESGWQGAAAIAEGAAWHCFELPLKTVIQSAETGDPMAWWPETLQDVKPSYASGIVAGIGRTGVTCFELCEG